MSKKAQVKTNLNLENPIQNSQEAHSNASPLLFGRKNYILMATGLATIFLGYMLMMGANNDVESLTAIFPKEEVYSARRIILAPIIIIIGFLIEIYAILSAKRDN